MKNQYDQFYQVKEERVNLYTELRNKNISPDQWKAQNEPLRAQQDKLENTLVKIEQAALIKAKNLLSDTTTQKALEAAKELENFKYSKIVSVTSFTILQKPKEAINKHLEDISIEDKHAKFKISFTVSYLHRTIKLRSSIDFWMKGKSGRITLKDEVNICSVKNLKPAEDLIKEAPERKKYLLSDQRKAAAKFDKLHKELEATRSKLFDNYGAIYAQRWNY